MKPVVGQVWFHENGDKRKVTRVSDPPTPSCHDVSWRRLDYKPGRVFSDCSFASWAKWAKKAKLVEEAKEDRD